MYEDLLSRSSADDQLEEREAARLHCVSRYHIIDAKTQEALDDITRAAARYFDVPIAFVSLVDKDKQWFKSRIGLDICDTSRSDAFCSYAIERDEVFIVTDASLDTRFSQNRLVTGEPFIRFYAGAVVRVSGQNIGTICIIDQKPRTFEDSDQVTLMGMARLVTQQFELSVYKY